MEVLQINETECLREHLYSIAFSLQNTNTVFIDYILFKQLSAVIAVDIIVPHILSVIENILTIYPTFELHINLHSFTISCFNKHKDLIKLLAEQSHRFSSKLSKMVMYNTTSLIDIIFKLVSKFIGKKDHRTEIIIIPKADSKKALNVLQKNCLDL